MTSVLLGHSTNLATDIYAKGVSLKAKKEALKGLDIFYLKISTLKSIISDKGCNYLGVNYRYGVGFEKNMQTTYSYFVKSCYDYNYARECTNLGEILCKYGNYTNVKQEAREALNKAYYELGYKKH